MKSQEKFSANIIKADSSKLLLGGRMDSECNKSNTSNCTVNGTTDINGTIDGTGDTNNDVDCFPSAS